ncbi:unnamed protein product [Urochloa humidicola]
MGEEVKKTQVEEAKAEEPKKEEVPVAVTEADKKEAAAAEGDEKKEEEAAKEPPPPRPPCILGINVHCTGCANKIKRCILRCQGVEGVEVNMAQNEVTVKGIVDPLGICERLRKRTMRNVTVISPLPPPPPTEANAAVIPKEGPVVVHSQVSQVTTVELLVNMHCEACAQQLQKMILKIRGIQSANINSCAGKLTVTGTMSVDKLVQFIHRRTGKHATVVPSPPPCEPPKEYEPKNEHGDKKPEEPPAESADKEDQKKPLAKAAADEKKDGEGEKKEDQATKPEDGAKKKEGGGYEKSKPEMLAVDRFPPEEMMKRMMYWSYPHKHYCNPHVDEEGVMARRMAMAYPYAVPMMQWSPPPPPPPPGAPPPMMFHYYNYGMVETPAPVPQYFSDENPNMCVIS